MTEIPWEIIIPTAAVLITGAYGVYRIGRWTKGVEGKLERVEESTKALILIHTKELVDFYIKSWGSMHKSNPSTEKDILLRKLRDGTISREESLRLKQILEKERIAALAAGAILTALAIGGLLLLLAILLGEK